MPSDSGPQKHSIVLSFFDASEKRYKNVGRGFVSVARISDSAPRHAFVIYVPQRGAEAPRRIVSDPVTSKFNLTQQGTGLYYAFRDSQGHAWSINFVQESSCRAVLAAVAAAQEEDKRKPSRDKYKVLFDELGSGKVCEEGDKAGVTYTVYAPSVQPSDVLHGVIPEDSAVLYCKTRHHVFHVSSTPASAAFEGLDCATLGMTKGGRRVVWCPASDLACSSFPQPPCGCVMEVSLGKLKKADKPEPVPEPEPEPEPSVPEVQEVEEPVVEEAAPVAVAAPQQVSPGYPGYPTGPQGDSTGMLAQMAMLTNQQMLLAQERNRPTDSYREAGRPEERGRDREYERQREREREQVHELLRLSASQPGLIDDEGKAQLLSIAMHGTGHTVAGVLAAMASRRMASPAPPTTPTPAPAAAPTPAPEAQVPEAKAETEEAVERETREEREARETRMCELESKVADLHAMFNLPGALPDPETGMPSAETKKLIDTGSRLVLSVQYLVTDADRQRRVARDAQTAMDGLKEQLNVVTEQGRCALEEEKQQHTEDVATLSDRLEKDLVHRAQLSDDLESARTDLRRMSGRLEASHAESIELQSQLKRERDGREREGEDNSRRIAGLEGALAETRAQHRLEVETWHAKEREMQEIIDKLREDLAEQASVCEGLQSDVRERDSVIATMRSNLQKLKAHVLKLRQAMKQLSEEKAKVEAALTAVTEERDTLSATLEETQQTLATTQEERDAGIQQIAEMTEARKEADASHAAEVEALSTAHVEETAATVAAHEERVQTLEQEMDAQRQSLTAEREAVEAKAAERLAALEAERVADVARLETEAEAKAAAHLAESEATAQRHAEETRVLEETHASVLEQERQSAAQALTEASQAAERQRQEAASALEGASAQHASALEVLTAQHRETLTAAETSHAEQMTHATEDLTSRFEGMLGEKEAEVQRVRAEVAAGAQALAALSEQHQVEIASLREELAKTHSSLEATCVQRDSLLESVAQLSTDVQGMHNMAQEQGETEEAEVEAEVEEVAEPEPEVADPLSFVTEEPEAEAEPEVADPLSFVDEEPEAE
eukprot:g2579.t1